MTDPATVNQRDRPVLSHPLEACLNIYQVAEWLQVSYKTVEQLPIKSFWLDNRRRFLGKHVLEFIEESAQT